MARENSERRYAFRIGTRGAQHRSKRNGAWKTFGYGDQIDLTMAQFQSGTYNNLGLQGPLVKGKTAEPDLADADVINPATNPPVRTSTRDASRTADQTEHQDIGDNDGDGVGGDEDAGDADTSGDAPAVSKRKVTSLIKGLEESSGSSEFKDARQKVIEADIFEEDSVPTKKADLIKALEEYRDEL